MHCPLTQAARVPRYCGTQAAQTGRRHLRTAHLRLQAASASLLTARRQSGLHGGQVQGALGISAHSELFLHARSGLLGRTGGGGIDRLLFSAPPARPTELHVRWQSASMALRGIALIWLRRKHSR